MNLITRGDWDGLICAVLLKAAGKVGNIRFAHPKDMQDGTVPVSESDIIANLPYVEGCGMWFDHHISEEARLEAIPKVNGVYDMAPSAAGLIYQYYLPEIPGLKKYHALVEETDRIDSAKLSVSDVIEPTGTVLLSYTIDPRTGLGKFQEYFHRLIELLSTKPLKEVMTDKDVVSRTSKVFRQQEACLMAFSRYSRRERNMIVTDFRDLDAIPPGNRFLVYALYPGANVSVRIFWGYNRQNVVVAVGHSIFNRTCDVDIGKLLRKFGGGGHQGAGTCQFPVETADDQITEILSRLRESKAEPDQQ